MNNFKSLIVSDYDGTIKTTDNINEMIESLKVLRMLIEQNMGFMISTGRLFMSIEKEIKFFEIPFNFLSCANGNILFDEYFNTIWKSQVSSKIIQELKPYYKNILAIDSLDEYGASTSSHIVEYVIHLVEEKPIRREIVNLLLSSDMFDYCTDGENKFIIHIFGLSNKIKTIEMLRKKLNISAADVYAIGDGPNDLDMIKKYNGYIIGSNLPFGEECAIQKYESLYPLTKDIQHGLVKKRMCNKC